MATERELNILIKAKDLASKTLDKYGEQFDRIGKSLLAVGAAGATGLGAAVKVTADFEQQMSRVGALSQATDEDLGRLTKTAKDLGASTSFSASQAAEGMSYLAMAGFDVNEQIAAMPGLLNAAAAGQTDLGSTADIVSNILSGFKLEASETGKVADVLTKTFTSSNTDLNMLGETMKYVAPIASAAGMSMEEMAAATGLMGNAGIQGSQAGTSLRAIIMRLQAPTDAAAAAMDKLGINVRNADGSMKGMPDIMAEFEKGLGGVDQASRDAALSTIIGMEASAGFQALLNEGSDTLRSYSGELENAGGTAEEIASKQLDNLNGALTILKSGLEGAAIAIGTHLTPYLEMAAERVTELVSWFNGLDPTLQRKIALFAAVGSGLALLTGALLVVIPMLPALGAAISALFGPVGLVIALVAALAAAFITDLGGIRTFLMSWISSVKEPLINFAQTTFTQMKMIITTALNYIQTFWQQHGQQIMTTVTQTFQSIWSMIQTVMTMVQTILMTAWSYIQQLIQEHGQTILSNVMAAFQGISQAIQGAAALITQIIEWAFPYIQQIIQIVMSQVVPFVISMFNKISVFIADVMPKIIKVITWAWQNVIQPLFSAVLNWLVPFIQTAFTAISNVISGVMDFIMGVIKTALSILTGDWSGAWDGIKQIVSGAVQAIKGILQVIGAVLSEPFKLGLNLVKGFIQSFYNVGKSIISGLINGIKSMASAAVNAAKDAVKGALNAAKSFLGINSPSKAFMQIGEWSSEGLANGIKAASKYAEKASEKLAAVTAAPVDDMSFNPGGAFSGGSMRSQRAAAGGGSSQQITIQRLILPDVKDPQQFSEELDSFALRQAFKSQ